MGIFDLCILGVGLAMDAFAVSICKGLGMRRVNIIHCLTIALFFGGFQGLMPLIGWLVGNTFANRIKQFDHWIAFILLIYIGGKMVIDAIKEWRDDLNEDDYTFSLDFKELFILAIATSIDALACGVTFSFTENFNIVQAILIIGIITFIICVCGVYIGNMFGSKFKAKAQLFGGIILILLGIKILLEHNLGI